MLLVIYLVSSVIWLALILVCLLKCNHVDMFYFSHVRVQTLTVHL